MNQTTPEVFISYAHGGESEAIAEHLLKLLETRGHKVIIDEKDVGYKDNIEEFEKRLGRGDCVIAIISDRYLRSEHCMFEMVCIDRHEEMYKRIFPIVLPNARKVYDRSGRVKYQKFWKAEEESHKKEIEEMGVSGGAEHSVADLTKLEQIRQVSGKVTDMLNKMMTLEPDALRRSEYAGLIAAVEERLAQAARQMPAQGPAAERRRYNLPGPPEYFIGRDRQLQKLHARLAEDEPLLLVNGLGGIGKTTVAQAYVNERRYAAAYDRIFWLFAGDDLAPALVTGLQRPLQIAWPENADLKTQLQVLATALQDLPGSNLLVLDNANDSGQLLELRPWLRSLRWNVLLTSRCEPDDFARMPLDELPLADARKLFCHHYFSAPTRRLTKAERATLDRILEQIDRHTLLTELLARAGRKKGLSLDEMLQRLQRTRHKDPDLQRKISTGAHADLTGRQKQARLHDYVLSMFAPEKLPEDQKEILTMLSVLPADEIPLERLAAMFAIEDSARNDFEDLLDDLHQNGWLSCTPGAYKLHPLLQDVIREKLPADGNNCSTLIRTLSEIMQDYLNVAFDYLPCALSVVTSITGNSRELVLLQCDIDNFYSKIGDSYLRHGQFEEAFKLFQERSELFEKLYKTNRNRKSLKNGLAISYEKLGDINLALGQFDEALRFFSKETKLFKELCKANPKVERLKKGLAISYEKLGDTHRFVGQYDQALQFFQNETQLFKELQEANPKNESLKNGLAISYSRLGDIHQALGQFDQALHFFQDETQLFKELNEMNPKSEESKNGLAASYSRLGDIHYALGQFDQALQFFQDGTKLFKELYEVNPKSEEIKNGIAISYARLGDIHQALGQFDRALQFFQLRCQLAKELHEANPKSESLKNGLAISYSKLGGIHQALGQFDQALQFFQNDIELTKELYEANPKSESLKNGLAISYEKLGDIHQALGQFDQALQLFQLRYEVGKELHEVNPKSESLKNGLAISYSKLGTIHQALGQFDQALQFFQLRCQIGKELYEANPKSVGLANGLAVSYCKLAGVAEHNGKLKEARALYGEAVAIWEKLVEKSDIPEYRNNLENARRDRDRLKDKG